MKWFEWNPELFPNTTSIKDILDTLPESPIAIPKIIQRFENPKSLFRINGAVNLDAHDIIHVLLGRGLLAQDEAFVIGFTIGNSSNADAYDRILFSRISTLLYPKPFKFSNNDEKIFNHGFDCGAKLKIKDVAQIESGIYSNYSVKEARANTGISIELLKKWYTEEIYSVCNSKVSKRLKDTYKL